MNDALISEIQTFTLGERARLEEETAEQLEGIYGWLPDGTFGVAKGYPAIAQIEEAKETRRRLEQFADDEKAAGIAPKDARLKLVSETAFTWLNRLTAFRLMEERKLLKQTISRLEKSNGFIYWLVDDAQAPAKAEFDMGSLPLNAMGEGPSDVTYRRFLLWQCTELSRDVSILFDPATLPSRLCPRPLVIRQLVADLNLKDLEDAWKPGNEETIGWLYQAFNSQELQNAFAAARESKKKFEPADIPAVTQLFTIRWVVRFLVENTLGRLWVEMHPNSALKDELGYLAPVQNADRPVKPVCEITFLDPCCGSMHFGLVAFDLFVRMYREEIINAGKPGWPATPSVGAEDEIASSIVANNLFGIDLDLRAVQLSALTLLLRARTQTPKCGFTDQNFACANVEQLTGGRLDELITATKFVNRAEDRILRALAARIADSPNLGSLLRLEKDLQSLVDAERKRMLATTQPELVFGGLTDNLFATTHDLNAFFDQLTESLAERLDVYACSNSTGAGHVAHEASKGLRYLRLVQRRYDVVATNPPYLSARKMNKRLAKLMAEQYHAGKQDLYAAFILRCQELLASHGLLGMLTMHSYMFISSYEDMRELLRAEVAIEALAHFGGGLFAVGNPGTLQTAAFVLRKEPELKRREENRGVYVRLVRERDAEAKRISFESAIVALRANKPHAQVFASQQSDFNAIPDQPWVYWFSPKLRGLFRKHSLLGDTAPPKQGLATADNGRFLRKWWEVGLRCISTDSTSSATSKRTGKRWFPYMKGGAPIPWFGNQQHVVNWHCDGAEIRHFGIESGKLWSRPQNTDYYFRRGVTWSDVSSKGFAGRLSPGGFVHDVKGMTCYPPESSLWTVLGIFNSSFAEFVLSGLNPTISFQVGDIERLPLAASHDAAIDGLVQKAVALANESSTEAETTYQFVAPPLTVAVVGEREQQLALLESDIDSKVSRLYGLQDEDLALIRQELKGGPAKTADTDGAETDESDADAEDNEGSVTWDQSTLAQAWISYALGTILGRYAICEPNGLGRGNFAGATAAAIRKLIDPDGVMVAEKDHPQDIVRRAVQCLELMRGTEAAQAIIRTAVGEDSGDPEELLRGWLDRFTGHPASSFWKYHLQLYRKRPIYWPLQSPKKKFTVWVFHEAFSKDTVFKVRSDFVEPKVRWLEARLKELKAKELSGETRLRRAAEREASQLADVLDDVQAFAQCLNRIVQLGYTPYIDDGVLLNAAPLWEMLPAWPETKKAWQELENENYDWAQQAMEYWPARVKEKCKTNKSFAIAHKLA